MDKNQILQSLGKKTNGEIYLGVVGAVRTGKSTFIKKCIELLVLPNIEDEMDKKRCMDDGFPSGFIRVPDSNKAFD